MFITTDSGLYRPRTREEDKELEMHVLNAPLIQADYVSSISQILSPIRIREITGLAKIIRDIAEPHVQTTIPNDMRVRPYRDADYYPHIQTGLKVELAYAYLMLSVTEQDSRKRNEYLQEAQRLEREVNSLLVAKNFFMHAAISYRMRGAAISYFAAASKFLNNGDLSATETDINNALKLYSDTKRFLIQIQSDEDLKKLVNRIRENGINGLSVIHEIASQWAKNQNNAAARDIQADVWGYDEFITMAVSNQFEGLMQDVLFGEMRCYALQGNYRMLTKTARELHEFAQNPKNMPAPVITESATIIKYDAERNKLSDDLVCTPFVSDSPPIVLEAAESIEQLFGKVSPKLWKPGERIKTAIVLP